MGGDEPAVGVGDMHEQVVALLDVVQPVGQRLTVCPAVGDAVPAVAVTSRV
jgi:hypothetical protein